MTFKSIKGGAEPRIVFVGRIAVLLRHPSVRALTDRERVNLVREILRPLAERLLEPTVVEELRFLRGDIECELLNEGSE